MFESSVIRKDTGSSLYIREPRQSELTSEQQFAAILARMSEAVDITILNSLLDRFVGVETTAQDLQTQLVQLLNGELQFFDINLPDAFTLPESRIIFGGIGAHNHTGGPFGKRVSHLDLFGITEDDHHPRVHALIGPDHYGGILEEMIDWAGPAGHRHDGLTGAAVWHQWILGVGQDDHHATLHDIQAHTGNLQALQILMGSSNVDDIVSILQLALIVHENRDVFLAHNLTLAQLTGLGLVTQGDLVDHTSDPVGHSDVADQGAQITLMQGDISSVAAALLPIGTNIGLLADRILSLETEMPLKMQTTEFAWRLENYGGPGTAIGGIAPVELGVFANLVVTQAQITGLSGVQAADIEDLTVTNSITIPDSALQMDAVRAQIGPAVAWPDPRPLLKDDLDRLRYAIAVTLGEPFDYASAAPPVLSATSSFAGDTMKTFEEVAWYRNWLMTHDYAETMVCDVFEDASFMASGSAAVIGHALVGPGDYVTQGEIFGGAVQDMTFYVIHVESSDPTQITVEITADGGLNWHTTTNADFDKARGIPIGMEGKNVQVRLAISGNAKVYSFGVLLGWRF